MGLDQIEEKIDEQFSESVFESELVLPVNAEEHVSPE